MSRIWTILTLVSALGVTLFSQSTVDPERTAEPPPEARLKPDDAQRLPAPLAAVPPMVDAARAVASGDREKLSSSLGKAIALADTPSFAAGLGFLAITSPARRW